MDTIIVAYRLGSSRGEILTKRRVTKEPVYGDTITVNNCMYEVVGVDYDYEVWQSTGVYFYDAIVKPI